MGDHLEENTFLGYATNKLATAERDRVEHHIDECAECRTALAVFVGRSSTPFAAEITQPSRFSKITELDPWMPREGDKLADRYTIGKQLGRGGMGHVFQATDHDLGIQVALKVLRPELTLDEEQIRHLRREILTSRKIAHPNVCRVFDLGKHDRMHFITMELVGGETLGDLLRAGPMPAPNVLDLLKQLLGALAAAHAEGIVHRDLKPANVMLDDTGKLKVMDFGLARDLSGEHSLKGQVGTPAYWSPEQSRGEAAGPPADLYAVGLIAYLLLTGETSTRAIRRRKFDHVVPGFRPWLAKCLREEPEERFLDAGSALAALAEVSLDAPRRWIAPAALAAILLLVGGGVFLATRGPDEKTQIQPGAGGSATVVDKVAPAAADAAQPATDAFSLDATISDAAVAVRDAGVLAPPSDAGRRIAPRHDAGIVVAPADASLPKPSDASLLYEK